MSCPKCGGASGLFCKELVEMTRHTTWEGGLGESQAEFDGIEPKRGKWTCADCGHRFNKDPFAANPAQREGS